MSDDPKMPEVRVIPFLPDYAITSDGEVWRVVRGGNRNHKRVPHRATGVSRCPKGYPQVCLQDASRRSGNRTVRIHRAVAEAWLGPRPPGHHVDHKDGNKLNNSASNLEYVTPAENVRRAIAMGLIRPETLGRKRRNSSKKLSLGEVDMIRAAAKTTLRKALATRFGVSVTTIGEIVRGETW